jgi:hypothetical protein
MRTSGSVASFLLFVAVLSPTALHAFPGPGRGHDHGDCDEEDHDADDCEAKPARTAAKVKGPVKLGIEVIAADVEIQATTKDEVSVTAKGCGPGDVALEGEDDDFEIEFDPAGSCEGPVVIKVPTGSSVEVATVEGNIRLKGGYKDVEAASVSGDITVESGEDVEIEAIQGKVKLSKVSKRARVESVNGAVELTTVGPSPIVQVETVSGDLRWSGPCGKGCRASIESHQGNMTLALDKASSFELRFSTINGKFADSLKTTVQKGSKNVMGAKPVRASFGKGEGTIRVESYEGDLTLVSLGSK